MENETLMIPVTLLKELRYAIELAVTSEDGLDGLDGEKLLQKLVPYLGEMNTEAWEYPYENEAARPYGWVKP